MATYHFVTDFTVRAAIQDVHRSIVDPEPWLRRWGDLVEVRRVRPGGDDGVGGCLHGTVRAPLGYRIGGWVETVGVEAPSWVRMHLGGAVEGTATWRLHGVDGGTSTTLSMTVVPAAGWLRLLTPAARPLFEAGHARVVRHAVHAAAQSLGADVVALRSRSVRHGDGGDA